MSSDLSTKPEADTQQSRHMYVQFYRREEPCMRNANIVVCTPGRLLQHFGHTVNFSAHNLRVLGGLLTPVPDVARCFSADRCEPVCGGGTGRCRTGHPASALCVTVSSAACTTKTVQPCVQMSGMGLAVHKDTTGGFLLSFQLTGGCIWGSVLVTVSGTCCCSCAARWRRSWSILLQAGRPIRGEVLGDWVCHLWVWS